MSPKRLDQRRTPRQRLRMENDSAPPNMSCIWLLYPSVYALILQVRRQLLLATACQGALLHRGTPDSSGGRVRTKPSTSYRTFLILIFLI